MKKYIGILVIAFGILLTGCDDNPVKSAEDGTEYKIETIDGCQYVYRSGGNQGYMAHKGNCNNPIHKYNH